LLGAVEGLQKGLGLLRYGEVSETGGVDTSYQVFRVLDAVEKYALDGVFPSDKKKTVLNDSEMAFLIDTLVDLISVTMQSRIVGELQGTTCVPSNLEVLLETLFARIKYDESQGKDVEGLKEAAAISSLYPSFDVDGMTVNDLARLSNVSKSAMRSVLHQQAIDLTKEGTNPSFLPFDQAIEFLKGRPKFVETYTSEIEESDAIRVPVAKDGSRFDRSCRRNQGYQIGSKGYERYFSNFHDALTELKKMPTARWRRPSKTSGTPSIVSAVRWESFSRSELGID